MVGFQWLDDETHMREMVLADLGGGMKDLFAQASSLDGGCALLRFLDQHANTLMTSEDIAYHLVEPQAKVSDALDRMINLGLVRRVNAAGLVWYGVTEQPDKRRLMHNLCEWQSRWRTRLDEIERLINGERTLRDTA